MSKIKMNHVNRTIEVTKSFYNASSNPESAAFNELMSVQNKCPDYKVVIREIKKNPNKKTRKGLTYRNIEEYILSNGTKEERTVNFEEYNKMRAIGKCYPRGRAYNIIVEWFLDKFPEVANFGCKDEDYNSEEVKENKEITSAAKDTIPFSGESESKSA